MAQALKAGTHPERTPRSEQALTAKSIALGLLLVLIATLGGFYARHILHTTRLAQNHLSLAVVFPFALTVLILRRPLRLNRGELLITFSMGLIASTLPTYFLSKLIGNISVPYYLDSPNNGWREMIQPHLPAWSIVPRGQALTWFFEGLPSGQPVPWGVWLKPLFWWCTLLAALCAVLLSTVVILRKQWIEYERIDYPLMELPLAMLEEERASIFRSPLFWIGFGISVFGILWNIGWYFNPSWPWIQYRFKPIDIGRHFQLIRLNLYWPIVGFAYFIKLDVSFSIWFFYLLGILQEGISNRLGLEVKHEDPYGTSFAAVGWQALGAWVVIVCWGLWIGRHHLRDVFRKAFRNDPTVDDSVEIMSYKAAVRSLILGLVYIAGFLYATGMNAWIVPVFIAAMMLTYLGITRIIVETGLITIRAPVVAQHFIQFAIGTTGLSGPTMTALGLSYGWYGDMKTTLMPALGHSVKLLDTVRANKRPLLIALVLAMAVGILSSLAFIIHMAYKTGAGNYGGQLSGGLARLPWDIIVKFTRSPVDTDWTKLTFFGAGIGITLLLYVMRSRFQAWPFHPLGFAAGTCYPVTNVVFPIFLGWMFKSLILRFGGVSLFNVARPVFHGLILGYYCGAGISFFVDVIWFPGHGHGIPFSD